VKAQHIDDPLLAAPVKTRADQAPARICRRYSLNQTSPESLASDLANGKHSHRASAWSRRTWNYSRGSHAGRAADFHGQRHCPDGAECARKPEALDLSRSASRAVDRRFRVIDWKTRSNFAQMWGRQRSTNGIARLLSGV
jgi:hypothetical protein